MATARLYGNIILMAALKLVGLLLSVTLIILQAAVFGTTHTADAYFFVRRLILSANAMIFEATNQLTVPEFVRELHGGDSSGHSSAIRRFGVPLVGVIAAIAVAIGLAADPIVRLLAPGFGPEKTSETVVLLRIVVVCLPLTAIAALAGAMNFSRRRFGVTTMAKLAPGVSLLVVFLVLGASTTPIALSWALVAGVAVMCAVIVWKARESLLGSGLQARSLTAKPKKPTRAVAVTLNAGAQMAMGWVDAALASLTGVGGVTILFIAQRLLSAAPGAVNSAVNSVYYTEYSHRATSGEAKQENQIASAIRISLFLTLPLVAFVMVSSEHLVRFLLERGAFTSADSLATADLVRTLAPLLLVNAVLAALLPAVLADDSLPLIRVFCVFGFVSIAVRLAVGFPLARTWGLTGVALSIILASSLAALVLAVHLHRRHGALIAARDIGAIMTMLSVGLASGLAAIRLSPHLDMTSLAGLSGLAAFVGGFFLLGCAAFRLEEVSTLAALVRGKMRKNTGKPPADTDNKDNGALPGLQQEKPFSKGTL